MSVLVVFASLLAASSPAAAARSLQQTINAAMIQNVLNAYEKDPTQTATQLASMVSSSGESAQFSSLIQQAITALQSYRGTLTSQLPAPVSSLNSLHGVNNLDTALAAQAATYVLQQLGSSNYQTVVNGLKTLLTSNGGGSATTYLSQAQSYTTALAFVQALGRTQDSHGDTSSVAKAFVNGLEGAAQSCIDSLPSVNGASSSSVITNQLNKCCPVISQTLNTANTLAGQSGLINFLKTEEAKYNIVSKCSSD